MTSFIKKLFTDYHFKFVDNISHFRMHYETYINGKLSNKALCKSFNGNFLQMIYREMNHNSAAFTLSQAPWNTGKDAIIRTDGVVVNDGHGAYFRCPAGATIDTYGILLSTNTDALSPTNGTVSNKILHGTSGGQLVYNQTSGTGIVVVGNQSSITVSRTWLNSSGSSVDVNKFYLVATEVYEYMYLEEKLSSTDTILNTQPYAVNITITITT